MSMERIRAYLYIVAIAVLAGQIYSPASGWRFYALVLGIVLLANLVAFVLEILLTEKEDL